MLAALPAEEVPAPEGCEQESDPAEQRDQRDHAPEHNVGRRAVVDQLLRRPVVGVGVVVAGPAGRGSPGRPAEEGGQLVGLLGVIDRIRPQPLLRRRIGEVVEVVSIELGESAGLCARVLERVGFGVVAVRLKVRDRLLARPIGARAGVLVLDGERRPMEVVGGVVGAEVGAVPEDRPVLHQAVVEEDALPVADLVAGEHRLPGRVHDAIGDRRVGAVGPIRQQAEDEEPEQDDDDRGLNPGLGDQQCAPRGLLRHRQTSLTRISLTTNRAAELIYGHRSPVKSCFPCKADLVPRRPEGGILRAMSQDYLLANQPSELERLQLQSRVWGPTGRQLLSKVDGGSGGRALDVGCGALGWLRILSEWVGPSGQVVGGDVDEGLLDAARTFLEAEGISNVELVVDDLFETKLEPQSFGSRPCPLPDRSARTWP